MESGFTTDEERFLNLELIDSVDDMPEIGMHVIKIFSRGLRNTPEAAFEVACLLGYFCPPVDETAEIGDYLWLVWDIMMDIVTSPDVTTEIQETFVKILLALRQHAKGETEIYGIVHRVWRDMPLLCVCMDAAFSDPTVVLDTVTEESLQTWKNINYFGARCLGEGASGTYFNAIYALTTALEEEDGLTDIRVEVATYWISHGARILLKWAQENIGYFDVPIEDTQVYVEGGPLYDGPNAMCLRRWGFWIDRFEVACNEKSGLREETRRMALEAAEKMRKVERGAWNTV